MSRRRRCPTCGERRAASGEWGGRPRAAGAALRLRGSSAPASGHLVREAAMAIGVDMLSAHSLPTAPSRSAVGLYREYCVTV